MLFLWIRSHNGDRYLHDIIKLLSIMSALVAILLSKKYCNVDEHPDFE